MENRARTIAIEELRERIQHLESGSVRPREALPFGIAPIDRHLPGGGLALGALHEVAGGGNGALDGAAAALFVAGIAARTRGKVFWCVTQRDLFMPGIVQAGLSNNRVVMVECRDEKGVLDCFEEALRCRGIGAVVGELARLPRQPRAGCSLPPRLRACSGLPCAVGAVRPTCRTSVTRQPPSPVGEFRSFPPVRSRCPALAEPGGISNFFVVVPQKVLIMWSKPAMPRVVSVYLPSWPTDRHRRMLGQQAPPADQPLVMIAREGTRRLVAAANEAAIAAGLRVGMPASKAQALVADPSGVDDNGCVCAPILFHSLDNC